MEKKAYTGIQGVDITTAGHLFNPQKTFALANEFNRGNPPESWMKIEVYPTVDRLPLRLLRRFFDRVGLPQLTPPGISEKDVREWQREYPNTRVSRVHLPFSYNPLEAWWRVSIAELGNGLSGLKEHGFHFAWMMFLGTAVNQKGLDLARALQDQQVGITAHPNIIEGFAKDNHLDDLKKGVAFVLAENERPYDSPILRDRKAIYDPLTVIDRIVKKYGLDGFLLGIDHEYQGRFDKTELLSREAIREQTQALHLGSGSHHDVLGFGDEKMQRFFEELGRTPFQHPVRAALDYNPLIFGRMSPGQQLQSVREAIAWINNSQGKK